MSQETTKISKGEYIIKSLTEKSSMHLDVCDNTHKVFGMIKTQLANMAEQIKKEVHEKDDRLKVDFVDRNPNEVEFRAGDDVVVAMMHTNIFTFENSHSIMKTSYVKEDNFRSHCGMISFYNFLADSFTYNRANDIGYLVARVFVNKDMHYFVEGKRQLGFMHNNFADDIINDEKLHSILESAIAYSLDFDMFTPPYNEVSLLTIREVKENTRSVGAPTGKRLGFKFQSDEGIDY